MKFTTRLAIAGASLLTLGGGGLAAVFTSAGPAGAQTTPPALSTPGPGITTPAPAPSTPMAPDVKEAPGTPDTDTIQDQAGDQSGPNDTTGPDTPEAPGATDAPEAPGA